MKKSPHVFIGYIVYLSSFVFFAPSDAPGPYLVYPLDMMGSDQTVNLAAWREAMFMGPCKDNEDAPPVGASSLSRVELCNQRFTALRAAG